MSMTCDVCHESTVDGIVVYRCKKCDRIAVRELKEARRLAEMWRDAWFSNDARHEELRSGNLPWEIEQNS